MNQIKKKCEVLQSFIPENILLICRIFILTFCFIFISVNLSFNPLLRNFDSFWLSFTDKATTETDNFVLLIVKITVLELALLTMSVAKT